MLGTGDFAVPTFSALYDTPHEVVALYTQPERLGQGHHRQADSRIKQVALTRGTPVFQPQNVNTTEALDELRQFNADVFVVAAYGQILSQALLDIPRLMSINVHASLLPKYRGAAPVAYAIWKGEAESGVCIIEVVPALDAGDVLGTVKTPIGSRETAGELEDRLAELAAPLTVRVLDDIESGKVRRIPQDAALMTRAPKLRKEQGAIDWAKPTREIDWLVRAMQPWPKAFTYAHLDGKPPVRLLVLEVRTVENGVTSAPGTVLQADKSGLLVQTDDGVVEIVRLQPEGKKPMPAADFLRGHPLRPGDRIGV